MQKAMSFYRQYYKIAKRSLPKPRLYIWLCLSILISPFPLYAHEDINRPLWKVRQDVTRSITEMKQNIRDMDRTLSEMTQLLNQRRLHQADRQKLTQQQRELQALRNKQQVELTKAQHYLKDFDANRHTNEKIQREVIAIDKRRSHLERRYQIGKFRIFYSLRGRDALPKARRQDLDRNQIPDYIQNVALQLVHADQFYTQVMGLDHPFTRPPFKGDSLRFIDINIVRTPLDPKDSLIKGKAWNLARQLPRRYFREPAEKTLMIDISSDYDLTYGVPAHELFHLFQYGYTQFASPWFTEGTAVWAQNFFGGVTPVQWKVPQNKQQLFAQKYNSVRFWEALCERSDPSMVNVPKNLTKHRYIGRNFYIIPKQEVSCMRFMRQFLTELAHIEARVTQEKNLVAHNWPRGQRQHPDNEGYIWEALRNVVE